MIPLLALAALCAAAPPDRQPCQERDDTGDAFQTCFDPDQGLQVAVAAVGRSSTLRAGPAVGTSWGWRSERASHSKATSYWLIDHRFLQVEVTADSAPSLQATAYQGRFTRHLAEGFILIPTANPIRIAFPFDVGFRAEIARYERRPWEGAGWVVEPARLALLLDPVRSETGNAWLAFGPSASYQVRSTGSAVLHELSPLTSLEVDAGLRSASGWWRLQATGVAGWVYSAGQPVLFRARGALCFERLVIALNDRPVWLTAEVRGSWRDAGAQRQTEWLGLVGITFKPFR